ncbi:MAG: T9SS type A sorting domain-containing protein [Flavobacteriales bacterium]|nr:T9SS type A sorting domain-containing protein [Flavobacteriales bacterium]
MKNLYISIPVLALALVAGSTTSAQTAKPRASKAAVNTLAAHMRGTHGPASLGFRGGANDECETATAITVTADCAGSQATYDATDATESQASILCNGYTSPEARDLWFSFVATGAVTNIRVEGTASFDPVLEGFSGSCGNLTSMGCADATFPQAGENTVETLTMATASGTTYFVRVYSYWSPEPTDFTFTLCAYAPMAAPNDLCTSVTPVAIANGGSTTFTGDNTGALDSEGLGLPQVWHAFTISDCMDVTIDLCGTAPAYLNWAEVVFNTCPVSADGVVASMVDQSTCSDGNTTLLFNSLPAGTYYYPVIRDEAAETLADGPYTVHVSAAIPTTYCDAALTECDETIGRVAVGTIDNTSDCEAGSVVDYTDQVVDITQATVLPITVENGGTPYAENTVTVWVDWNQDNTFCQGNEAHVLTSADEGVTFTGSIMAPPDALPGTTRMRVRMSYGTGPVACGTLQYGEIEDYTVNVLLGNSIAENSKLSWTVFPNPNTGDMTVRFGGNDSKVAIELFDVAGRSVHQEQRQLFNGQQANLGLAGTLAAGTYTLRLTSSEGRSEQRVVVQ